MAHLFAFIGIDPGKKGGVAVITEDGDRLISREMPVSKVTGEIDVLRLRDALKFVLDSQVKARVFLEQTWPRPTNGVRQSFTTGAGFGRICAVLDILGLKTELVNPSKWKKSLDLIKKGKISSCKLALDLFPGTGLQTRRGRWKDGEAEALLLAEYGRRLYGGIL